MTANPGRATGKSWLHLSAAAGASLLPLGTPHAQELRRARAKDARRAAAASRDMRWPLAIIAGQLLVLIACIVGYRLTGLTVEWSMPPAVPLVIVALVTWILTYPYTRTDSALACTLLVTGATIVVAAQYPVLAVGRPLVDATLLRLDHALGVDVAAVVSWAQRHPLLSGAMSVAYATYIPQQFVLVLLLARLRDRRGIWTFLGQQHLCLGIALVICLLWPASEPYAFLGLDVPHPQTRTVQQVAAYNSGSSTVVRVDTPSGLIQMPSCHVAGAIFFVWAFRRVRFVREAAIVVNGLMVLATVAHGIHYFMDVVGGIVLAVLVIAGTEFPALRRRRSGAVGAAPLGSVATS